ncbi:MAG TPA: DUF72 domain-containing protein [Acidimicrobiales bacterium]|nr:DUF72 domain-containing protein [Acidimicrobiales bacterium]
MGRRILVGTASWTDRSLVTSGWYPEGVSSAEDRLRHYASRFRLVEVDSTYYALPRQVMVRDWASRTPADFTFDVKAFSLLTQHPTRRQSIPRGIDVESEKATVYLKDLDEHGIGQVWDRFLDGVDPLRRTGKLGCLVFQFPPWFTSRKANRDYVVDCADRAAADRIAVEFRSPSWFTPEEQERTFALLAEHSMALVCPDMPQRLDKGLPRLAEATSSELAVMKFHGRNREGWDESTFQGLTNYRYRPRELEGRVPDLRRLAREAAEVHVVFRNMHGDNAVTNAAQLQELVTADV